MREQLMMPGRAISAFPGSVTGLVSGMQAMRVTLDCRMPCRGASGRM